MIKKTLRSLRSLSIDVVEKIAKVYVLPYHAAWELPERVHLTKLFNWANVDCVFDVGANSGQYALMLRQRVGYKGAIISFEPIPEMAAILRQKAETDPLWFIEEVALSNSVGSAVFNIMVGDQFSSLATVNNENATLFGDQCSLVREQMVVTGMLSEFYEKYAVQIKFSKPFLKMDTQGHDLSVVAGGGAVLNKFVGLQSELAVVSLYQSAPTFQEALSLYEEAGFVLSALVPNNQGHFPRLLEFDCIMVNKLLLP